MLKNSVVKIIRFRDNHTHDTLNKNCEYGGIKPFLVYTENFIVVNLLPNQIGMNFLYLILFSTIFAGHNLHPVHVSVANLEWVQGESKFTVSFKLFKDDFQYIINSTYDTSIDLFANDAEQQAMEVSEEIGEYVSKHFMLTVKDNPLLVSKPDNVKINDDSIWIYFSLSYEGKDIPAMATIKNSLMMDLFNDQTNLLILTTPKGVRGFRFNTKNKSTTVKF